MSRGSEAVIRWRRRAKTNLMIGFGGECGICKYSKCTSALTFHHLDPTVKEFTFSGNGVPRAWKKMLDEAAKCVLLCRNCHAEVHSGVTSVPDGIRRFTGAPPMRMRRIQVKKRTVAGRTSTARVRDDSPPCPVCGGQLFSGTRFCSNACRARARRTVERPEGRSLREMVQQSSRVAVAARFGVSETAVRKWLKQDSLNGIT